MLPTKFPKWTLLLAMMVAAGVFPCPPRQTPAQEKAPAPIVNQGALKKGDHKKAALAPDQFDALAQLILPAAERGETKWLEVAWMTNTLEARKKAAAEDKPIVVWTMSACPLGGD